MPSNSEFRTCAKYGGGESKQPKANPICTDGVTKETRRERIKEKSPDQSIGLLLMSV